MDKDHLEQIKQDLEKLLAELREKNQEVPVVVEGDNDIVALKTLELPGEVLKLNQGKPIFNLVEEWSQKYREMIILTDWDRKGGRLARILSEAFDANDMKYDMKFRKKLAFLCKKEIKDVQGLPKFMDNLETRLASRTMCETWNPKTN